MFRTLILFAFICTTLVVKAQENKGTLFIIGGGSRPPEMIDRLIKESGINNGGYAIILPMSSSEPDSSVYYAKLPFEKAGITKVYGLQFKKDEKPDRLKLDSLRKAKLIYISGGDQERFMNVVRHTQIEETIREAFKNGATIAGTSAGAAVMSKVMITGNELKHKDYASTFNNIETDNIETKDGLGLIDKAIIDQHFVRRSRYNRLISAVIDFPDLMGIGIDESTALLVKGDHIEVVGESQVIVFENKSHSRIVKNTKMSARGIELNIYLPGDTFKLE